MRAALVLLPDVLSRRMVLSDGGQSGPLMIYIIGHPAAQKRITRLRHYSSFKASEWRYTADTALERKFLHD